MSDTDTTREAESSSSRDAPSPLTGVAIAMSPAEMQVLLRPATSFADRGGMTQAIWHKVSSPNGISVTLEATDNRERVLRLTTRSKEPRWQAHWTRWTYTARHVPQNGREDAPAPQDHLSADGATLTLHLARKQDRTVYLEFAPVAEDGDPPASAEADSEQKRWTQMTGNYPFEVVVTDTEQNAEAATNGTLLLRHPPATLLNYLPAIYAESGDEADARFPDNQFDDASATGYDAYQERPFFERYLRGFEDCIAPMQERISQFSRLFDAQMTPTEFLPWLATWVGLALNENWPELKRRILIAEAVELYRWRGTRRGLSRYLQIYTGVMPSIEDTPYTGITMGPSTEMGTEATLGGLAEFAFYVTLELPPGSNVSEQIIRDIIEAEKPAHTVYELRLIQRR